MSAAPLRMLWLEPEETHREAVRSLLADVADMADAADDREAPVELCHASSVDAARDLLSEQSFGAAVLCVQSTGKGVRHLMELRAGNDDLPIVIVVDSDEDAAALLACGAQELLVADELDVCSVLRAVHCAIDRLELEKASPPPAARGPGRLCFATFELDTQRLELREGGDLVKLHPTPMRLLAYLVDHADRVVSKQELLEAVWEGTFVSDYAISSALKEVRQILHDDGVSQRFVKTLRGSGYRFLTPEPDLPAETSPRDLGPIAVLPFDDLSRGRELSDFAASLQEGLVESIARLGTLRVVSASSTQKVAGEPASPLALARALGVAAAVLGSVRTSRKRIRVSVQLMDTSDGGLLWADHFEQPAAESPGQEHFRVIASQIERATQPPDAPKADPGYALEAEAAEACLLAEFHHRQGTWKSLECAQRHYQRAIERAPACAPAYVGLADVLLRLCGHGRLAPQCARAPSRQQALPRAIRYVGQALAIDPQLARAHALRGAMLGGFEWQWAEARMALDHALELRPGDSECLIEHAKLTAVLGDTEGGVAMGREALDRDPLNVPLRLDYARLLRLSRRLEEARLEQLRVLEMHPDFAAAHADLGSTLDLLGRGDEAIEAWLRMLKLSGFPVARRTLLARAHAAGGPTGYWRAWLDIAGDGDFGRKLPAEWLWLPCARLRDFDQAFAWLDRACRSRSGVLAYVAVDPLFDAIREDPRFEMLSKRVGLAA